MRPTCQGPDPLDHANRCGTSVLDTRLLSKFLCWDWLVQSFRASSSKKQIRHISDRIEGLNLTSLTNFRIRNSLILLQPHWTSVYYKRNKSKAGSQHSLPWKQLCLICNLRWPLSLASEEAPRFPEVLRQKVLVSFKTLSPLCLPFGQIFLLDIILQKTKSFLCACPSWPTKIRPRYTLFYISDPAL